MCVSERGNWKVVRQQRRCLCECGSDGGSSAGRGHPEVVGALSVCFLGRVCGWVDVV